MKNNARILASVKAKFIGPKLIQIDAKTVDKTAFHLIINLESEEISNNDVQDDQITSNQDEVLEESDDQVIHVDEEVKSDD